MRAPLLFILISLVITGYSQPDTLSITLENVTYAHTIKFLPVQLEHQDLRLAYMDVAPIGKDNGKTVVLFHGKNFGGYYWTSVLQKLTEAGYRVVVPDQIGFGKSSKPFLNYSFHTLAFTTKKLLDTLDLSKVTLLGHSMGGMLATRFALLYPERVEKLILENPIGLEDYRSIIPYSTIEAQYKIELTATAESIRRYYQSSYFKTWKPEYDRLVNIAAGVRYSADFPRYAKVAALTYQMIYEQPVVHEFALLKVPTVLIIGVEDRTVVGKNKLSKELQDRYGNYAVLGKQTAAKIPGAVLIELKAGHIPHLEIPQEFMNVLLKSL
jgi:pimeloyl-ACP methyl ester carboxylesterase